MLFSYSWPTSRVIACALMLLLAGSSRESQAQVRVDGHVLDEHDSPVPYTNVQLLQHADSSFVHGTVADEEGAYLFESVAPGSYLLYVSLIGYRDHLSEPLTLAGQGEKHLQPVTLQQEAIQMEEVSVEARRALYEQKGDRLVINVGTSLTLAGASALTVLERSPGIIVDKLSNSISMLGKDGVRVMVNGKLNYLSADGLVQFLDGLSADNIETIELITSPSAEFDAEGNAGYINIVLKRNQDDGLNGSMSLSAGYGNGETGNGSVETSYRRGKINLFGNYSFFLTGQNQLATNFRRISGPEGLIETSTIANRDPRRIVHNLRLAIDYIASEKTTLGIIAATFSNRWTMDAVNRLTVLHNEGPIILIRSDNDEINHWRHAMGNVNFRHKIAKDRTLTIDVDRLQYWNDNPTDYLNTTTNVASGAVTESRMESGKSTPLHITATKADYDGTHGQKWRIGAGVKGSFARFTNEATFEGTIESEWVAATGLSSRSELREDLLAAYASADYQVSEKFAVKAGLRYEYTDANLGSVERKDIVDRQFGSLFPSASLMYKATENVQIGGSSSRRITRPSFGNLAPFLYFIDPYTLITGNVALQPAIINSVKGDLTVGSTVFSISYDWEDSTIVGFQSHVLMEENVQLIYPTNFRSARSATALLAVPLKITNWWSTQSNVMGTWREVDSYRNGELVAFGRSSVRINSTQNFTLPRNFTFELSGFYQSAVMFGDRDVAALYSVNVALQKSVSARGKLTLAVDDAFDNMKFVWKTGGAGDSFYTKQVLDFVDRTVRLSYTTRFGDGKAGRQRATAAQEESQRAQ